MVNKQIKKKFKIITEQNILPDVPAEMEGFPMRSWSVELYMLGDDDQTLLPASVFEKVVYELHPSFPKPKQTFKKAPFKITETGWGEFDMVLRCMPVGKGGNSSEQSITHDLNFRDNKYEAVHTITFRNPKPELLSALEAAGANIENGVKKSGAGTSAADKKKGRKEKNVDMEKLADGLQKLSEDDLLHVVQLVHDNKTAETYTKNDVENGEFHVDLYTLPDALVKQLWDFTATKTDL